MKILKKILQFYYRYKVRQCIKLGYWNYYSGISGLFMINKGLSSVILSIKNNYITSRIFSLNEKTDLLKENFEELIKSVMNNYRNIKLIDDFCNECTDVVIRLARGNSVILQDPNVRLLLLKMKSLSSYKDELCQIWQIPNPNSVYLTEEELVKLSAGSKNSAPIDLVKQMYELQAKGCPVPPNKNMPNNNS